MKKKPTKKDRERAPLCAVCEQRHWSREPHVWRKKNGKDKTTRRRSVPGRRRSAAEVKLHDEIDQIERWTGNARVSVSEWTRKALTEREQALACVALLRLNRIHRETISLMEKLGLEVG